MTDSKLTYLKPPAPSSCYRGCREGCECEQPERGSVEARIEYADAILAEVAKQLAAQQARIEFCDRCETAHGPELNVWDERIEAHRAGECQACAVSHDYCYPTDNIVESGHFECPKCAACPTWNKAHAEAAHRLVDGRTCGECGRKAGGSFRFTRRRNGKAICMRCETGQPKTVRSAVGGVGKAQEHPSGLESHKAIREWAEVATRRLKGTAK